MIALDGFAFRFAGYQITNMLRVYGAKLAHDEDRREPDRIGFDGGVALQPYFPVKIAKSAAEEALDVAVLAMGGLPPRWPSANKWPEGLP